MAESLTAVGASVRAAVHSAVRAGFIPHAGDLYADLDLAALAGAECVPDYPRGLARVCAGSQPGGWMYTGGLENYPALVRQLADLRPLWGNPAAVLRRVRQPHHVVRVLRAAGLACPDVWTDAENLPRDGDWLRKPLRSTGGLRIARCQPALRSATSSTQPASTQPTPAAIRSAGSDDASDARWYYQQTIEGLPVSAVYLAAAGQSLLLGISEQLIGTPWLGSGGFRYSGSIGPLKLPALVREQFVAVGQALAAGFDLIGLFGVDAILAGDVVWPVEVNPRYTASVEVLERGYGCGLIAPHVETCKSGRLQAAAGLIPRAGMISPDRPIRLVCGKAVLFARQPLVISRELSRSWLDFSAASSESAGRWPTYADVPAANTAVPMEGPIVTLLAAGADVSQVRRKLQALAAAEEGRLYDWGKRDR